jgi:eukaryotic-like serine/threonine-protein kinase
MSLSPGTRLGSYEIVSAVGAGGMGEVYRAKDTTLNRDVALKLLPASFEQDPDRVTRFRREAQLLASLNHPNIAQIYGFESGALVMEFVDGEDLAQRLARGPLPLDEALPIARQIADALDTAHEQGIIHRDLKPANIKVRPDGTVKVLDFGLAKALAPDSLPGMAEASNSPTLTMRATQMGVIIGTAAYMAPEQAKGRVVDRRADVWAFGVVLYEMLAGKRAYDAEDISETLAAVLTREVDWTKLPEATPARLRGLLHDCLVRDPKQRLRDMGEARRILDQVMSGAPESSVTGLPAPAGPAATPTPARAWTRLVPWMVAALALGAAAFTTGRMLTTPSPPSAPVVRSREVLKDPSGLMDLSRDGTEIVYMAANANSGFVLAVRELDQFDGRTLPGTEGAYYPHFSPAADWILFALNGKLEKIQVTGGASIALCDGDLTHGAAWGEDDTIVFSGPKGLMRVPASGGTPQPLTTLDEAKGETAHIRPQFLPGGRELLFTVVSRSPDSPQFAVLDLQKGTYRIVAKGGDNGRYVDAGYLTYGRNGTLFALPFDLATLSAAGSEAPVVQGISAIGPTGTADYAVSANGVLAYSETLAQGGTSIAWADRKGAPTPIPGDMRRQWGTGRLSPDGRRLANGVIGDQGTDLWVVDLTRGTATRLTFGGTNDLPVWMPDGRALIYSGAANGKAGLYRVLADGTGKPELLLETPSPTPTSVTPDGKAVLFTQLGPNGHARIMKLALEATPASSTPEVVYQSATGNGEGQVSPDGHWLAFVSTETGRAEVYVMPFPGPGAKVQVSTNGGLRVRWAKSGREVFFWNNANGNATLLGAAIQTTPLTAGVPHALFTAFSGTTFDVAPDGEHFLVETVGDATTGAVFATVSNWFDELQRRAPRKKE